jgi:hypothetical protein
MFALDIKMGKTVMQLGNVNRGLELLDKLDTLTN